MYTLVIDVFPFLENLYDPYNTITSIYLDGKKVGHFLLLN